MNRKKKNIFMALSLSAVLAIGIPCYAGTTQEQIDAVSGEKAQAQTQLMSTQERIEALEAQKGNSEAYLNELNTQLSDMSEQMASLQAQYDAKLQEISQIEQDLDEAKESEKFQYNDMKLRIKYIYEESTNAGALESLFSAESFTDFLNRAENMSQINQYDREMLESYQDTVNDIKQKEEQLVSEKQNIEELQAEQQQQQEALEAVYENSYREYQQCMLDIQNSQGEQSELLAQIEAHEDSLNQLLAKKYSEEAAQREAEAQAAAAAQAEAERAAQSSSQTSAPSYEQSGSSGTTESAPQPSQNNAPADAGNTGASDNTQETGSAYLGNFTLTAYCSCSKCCGKWSAYAGLTASGAYAQQGVTVAMGGVPFGTKLLINGTVYTVQDRGTPYGHVDIYFSDHQAAVQFGLQHADVYQVN